MNIPLTGYKEVNRFGAALTSGSVRRSVREVRSVDWESSSMLDDRSGPTQIASCLKIHGGRFVLLREVAYLQCDEEDPLQKLYASVYYEG